MPIFGRRTLGHALFLSRANLVERVRYGPITHAEDNPSLAQAPYALTQAQGDGMFRASHCKGVGELADVVVTRHCSYRGVPGMRVWFDLMKALEADRADVHDPSARWLYLVRGDSREPNFGYQRFELQCPLGPVPAKGVRAFGTYRFLLRTYAKSPVMSVDDLLVKGR